MAVVTLAPESFIQDVFLPCLDADAKALAEHWQEHAVWRFPGHNPLSGRYAGSHAILALMMRRKWALNNNNASFDLTITNVAARGMYVAIFSRVDAACNGKHYSWNATWMHFFEDDKVAGCWLFVDKLDSFDAFWHETVHGH